MNGFDFLRVGWFLVLGIVLWAGLVECCVGCCIGVRCGSVFRLWVVSLWWGLVLLWLCLLLFRFGVFGWLILLRGGWYNIRLLECLGFAGRC